MVDFTGPYPTKEGNIVTETSIHIEGFGWVEIKRSVLHENTLRIFLEIPAAEKPQVHRKVANIINGLNGRHVCFNRTTHIMELIIPSQGCKSFTWEHPFMRIFKEELQQEFDITIVRWKQAR